MVPLAEGGGALGRYLFICVLCANASVFRPGKAFGRGCRLGKGEIELGAASRRAKGGSCSCGLYERDEADPAYWSAPFPRAAFSFTPAAYVWLGLSLSALVDASPVRERRRRHYRLPWRTFCGFASFALRLPIYNSPLRSRRRGLRSRVRWVKLRSPSCRTGPSWFSRSRCRPTPPLLSCFLPFNFWAGCSFRQILRATEVLRAQ